jgi:hypothetical protein
VALASYFGKAALSAASVLAGFSIEAFRRTLERQGIGVAFDDTAADAPEGRRTLELLVDLLARLYPHLVIRRLNENNAPHATAGWAAQFGDTLRARAQAANRCIELPTDHAEATVWVVVGSTQLDGVRGPATYVGSTGWSAGLSTHVPLTSGRTRNPYGAGAAACLGAAAVFRAVFAQQLDSRIISSDASCACTPVSSDAGEAVWFSLLTGAVLPQGDAGPLLPEHIPIDETYLVGLGAIGQTVAWALSRTPGLEGTLHLVDHQSVDDTNPQRYVWITDADVHRPKVDVAAGHFAGTHGPICGATDGRPQIAGQLRIARHPTTWAAMAAASEDYHFERVLLALDSASDRVAAQASLPRWIANAWTQPENLGVSRHPRFGEGACVACLYFPQGARKSRDVLVAEAIGFRGEPELLEVRLLLASGAPVSASFLSRVAERLGIPLDPLLAFEGAPLEDFYAHAVCGGVLLRLGGDAAYAREVQVPMAFQSALAGLLLAAELVADAGKLREALVPTRTEVDLLRPLGARLTSPAAAHQSGRCLCHDAVFRSRYAAKYGG